MLIWDSTPLKMIPLKSKLLTIIFLASFTVLSKADAFESSNLANTLAKAQANNKNVFVSFKADWCLPCQMFMSGIEANQEVNALLKDKFVSVLVDIESNAQKDWQANYRVACLPTSYILDSKGQIMSEFTGHMPAKQLLTLLQPYAAAGASSQATIADTKINLKAENKTSEIPEILEKKALSTKSKSGLISKKPEKVMMNNAVIASAKPTKTITVGTFQSIDNVTKYKAKLEELSGYQYYITMNDKAMYQLNLGKFHNTLEVKEQLQWVKNNITDFYIRKTD